MVRQLQVFKLSAQRPEGVRHFIGDRVDARSLSEGKTQRWVTVTRTGKFYDPRYGEFDITKDMLLSMVRNFDADVYGQEIVIDLSHEPQKGAGAFVKKLQVEGNGNAYKLRALVEFTEYGVEAVKKRGFIYLSAEFTDNYVSNENPRTEHGPTLLGAALTPRPVIKRLDPVRLSEDFLGDAPPTYLSQKLEHDFIDKGNATMKKLLEELKKKLAELKLVDSVVTQLCEAFEKVAKPMAEESMQRELMENFVTTGKELAEQLSSQGGDTAPVVQLSVGGPSGLSADDVKKLLAEQKKAADDEAKQLAEKRDANVKLFTDAIEGAEGLPEDIQRQLCEGVEDLITPEMSDSQVKALAESQLKLGNRLASQTQLASMGFEGGPAGSVRITVDESNAIKQLQETIDKRLGVTGTPDSRRFAATGGQLLDENKKLAEKFLAIYDSEHAGELHAEAKRLAAGDGIVSDVAVPASFERTVIREALFQMVGLQFVNADTLPFASSHIIPYSYRDNTAAGRNNTRVYEGGSVPRAGVIQTSETAYPIPQKIAFEVSDELRYLTSTGRLNWDALIENQQNASRIIREDTEQMIFNEVLQSSDEYAAAAIAAEDLAAQTDATNQIFVTANFPVCHPRKVYDLQGNQVGSTVNPITITLAGSAIEERAGQTAAGTYYVMDYNLGEFYFVDESDAIQTPGAADTLTISYSYSGNVYAFDTDLGTDATDVHWDNFLYRYGLRKTVIEDDRYHDANFGLMSGNAMTQIEQAKQFAANSKRAGTDLMADGNLGRVKDVPNFKTKAPGLWMGDQRIIIGERGISRLRMMKPWSMGELENQKDSNGRFTGKKEAYGDQFLILHTPTQLKRAYTSIVLYSATGRVARAAA